MTYYKIIFTNHDTDYAYSLAQLAELKRTYNRFKILHIDYYKDGSFNKRYFSFDDILKNYIPTIHKSVEPVNASFYYLGGN